MRASLCNKSLRMSSAIMVWDHPCTNMIISKWSCWCWVEVSIGHSTIAGPFGLFFGGLLWLIGMQIRSHKAFFLFLSNNSCPFSTVWPRKKQKDKQTTNKPSIFSKPINLGMSRLRSMPAKTYHPPTWQSADICREQRTPWCFMNFPRKPEICWSKVRGSLRWNMGPEHHSG